MGCCQSTPKADQADPAQTTTQVLPWRTAAVVVQCCFLLPLSMPSLDPQESQLGVWLSEPGSSAASGGGSKAGASRTRSCTRTCGQHDCTPEGTKTSQTRWGRLHPSSSWNLRRACCRGPEGQQAAAAAAPCVHSSARAPLGSCCSTGSCSHQLAACGPPRDRSWLPARSQQQADQEELH